MRVYIEPTGTHSRAMVRVARALERYAPPSVVVASSRHEADVVVMHVISSDAIGDGLKMVGRDQKIAVIQYCLLTTNNPSDSEWSELWSKSLAVWSYYDLSLSAKEHKFKFVHAPLGIDDVFKKPYDSAIDPRRERLFITTGYVNGPGAEAIEAVWVAGTNLGYSGVHVGPASVEGMSSKPHGWNTVLGLSDRVLARLYRRASFVGALRHIEGFELPAAEGLACGARPIMFIQPATSYWYVGLASFVADLTGQSLVDAISIAMTSASKVTEEERVEAITRFDWEVGVKKFWSAIVGDK